MIIYIYIYKLKSQDTYAPQIKLSQTKVKDTLYLEGKFWALLITNLKVNKKKKKKKKKEEGLIWLAFELQSQWSVKYTDQEDW